MSLVMLMQKAIDAYEADEIDGDQLCEVMQEVIDQLRALLEHIRFEGGEDAQPAQTPEDAPPEASVG